MPNIFIKDSLRLSVERASKGKITVLYDDMGYPSYMYVIPKFTWTDIYPMIDSLYGVDISGYVEYKASNGDISSYVHQAFIRDMTSNPIETYDAIYVGVYESSWMGEGENARLVSLPGRSNLYTTDTFENTLTEGFKKNPWFSSYPLNRCEGWHIMTNWEYSAAIFNTLLEESDPFGVYSYNNRRVRREADMGGRIDLMDSSFLEDYTLRAKTGYCLKGFENNLRGRRFGINNIVDSLCWVDGIFQSGVELRSNRVNEYFNGDLAVSSYYGSINTVSYMWVVDEPSTDVIKKIFYDRTDAGTGYLTTTAGVFCHSKFDSTMFILNPDNPGTYYTNYRAIPLNAQLINNCIYTILDKSDDADLDFVKGNRVFLKYSPGNISCFARGSDVYWNPNAGVFSWTTVDSAELNYDTTRPDEYKDLSSYREYDRAFYDSTYTEFQDCIGYSDYVDGTNVLTAQNPARNLNLGSRLVYIAPTRSL